MAFIAILKDRRPHEVMEVVREMREQGLVQGRDFDFAYTPPNEDWMNGVLEPRYTTFTFYEEKWGTWFTLKWS
jgi:pentatricopeptide repeat protein